MWAKPHLHKTFFLHNSHSQSWREVGTIMILPHSLCEKGQGWGQPPHQPLGLPLGQILAAGRTGSAPEADQWEKGPFLQSRARHRNAHCTPTQHRPTPTVGTFRNAACRLAPQPTLPSFQSSPRTPLPPPGAGAHAEVREGQQHGWGAREASGVWLVTLPRAFPSKGCELRLHGFRARLGWAI